MLRIKLQTCSLLLLVFMLQCCLHCALQPSMLKSLSHMNSIRSPSVLFAKKETKSAGGKGFGKVVEVAKTSSADTETATITTSQDFTTADIASNEVKSESTNILTDNEKIRSTKLFRKMKLEKIRSLEEKLKYLKDEETLIASDPSVGAVPELVADRMIKRITLFFGIPVFGGLMIFVGAFFYSKRYDVVVPPAIIAYATQFPFIIGLLGITYAILSSSWDNEDGSAIGIKEFQLNIQRIRDGFSRTRDTAKLQNDIERELDELRLMDK